MDDARRADAIELLKLLAPSCKRTNRIFAPPLSLTATACLQ
jgi:hypothetical protein